MVAIENKYLRFYFWSSLIGWECFGANDEAGLDFATIYLEFESCREKILMAPGKKNSCVNYRTLHGLTAMWNNRDWHPASDETSD